MEKEYSDAVKQIHSLFDASILIDFHHDVAISQKKKIMRDVLTLLNGVSSDFTGEIEIPKNLKSVIRYLGITSRWEGSRDNVTVGNVRLIGDPLWERIHKKLFEKAYETKHPVELLVYHDLQSSFYEWSGELISRKNEMAEWLEKSNFQRIWIYDYSHNQMLQIIERN